jgi:hypothetical protein
MVLCVGRARSAYKVDWKEYNRRNRIASGAFVRLPSLRASLVILLVCSRPHLSLLGRLLHVASDAFYKHGLLSTARGLRKYRVLECAEGKMTDAYMEAAADIMSCSEVRSKGVGLLVSMC